ncbi:MAG: hypothetical protein J1F25_07210 [Prevotellaceae bacterium]|nr:hypothetical protein [Prevotellaceae bacterium]
MPHSTPNHERTQTTPQPARRTPAATPSLHAPADALFFVRLFARACPSA